MDQNDSVKILGSIEVRTIPYLVKLLPELVRFRNLASGHWINLISVQRSSILVLLTQMIRFPYYCGKIY